MMKRPRPPKKRKSIMAMTTNEIIEENKAWREYWFQECLWQADKIETLEDYIAMIEEENEWLRERLRNHGEFAGGVAGQGKRIE